MKHNYKYFAASALSSFLLAGALGASAQTLQSTTPQATMMKIDFDSREDFAAWRVVNDGVMGGKSEGGILSKDGYMNFSGTINTNGGGFSSIRNWVQPGAFEGADTLTLKVRSDGRKYQVNLRTGARHWGRSVAYRADIPATPKGEWAEVSIQLSDLSPSVFGRKVKARDFDKTDVRILGIILADGQDGPFNLDIKEISTQ